MLSNSLYLDVGGYQTLGAHFQRSVGVDPTGETQITGLAPYWRIAMEKMVGDARWEFGTFGMAAHTYPGRDSSEGKDRILDWGFDSQYQVSAGTNDITALVSCIYERQNWTASEALGATDKTSNSLWNFNATLNVLHDKTIGGTVKYFLLDGRSDHALYADSQKGSPASDGFIFQASYMPLNKSGGPAFWSKSNVKLSLQYTVYNRFDGARTNYDGAGSDARHHNTLYLEAWIAF
jgi:hypothetical protein